MLIQNELPLKEIDQLERCALLLPVLAQGLAEGHQKLATAESCTGGLVAAICTAISGSSVWFDRGFVTYSNDAKHCQLGVAKELIEQHGAVSEPVARAMAQGAIEFSQAQTAIAITGVAGPSGGSPEKPVGTVWFAWAFSGQLQSEKKLFAGTRAQVREAAAVFALNRLCDFLGLNE